MIWMYDDGGRAQAGFKGTTGDCVCRAIAIASASGQVTDYRGIYDGLKVAALRERPRNGRKRSTVHSGVATATIHRYLTAREWRWVPTMGIGTGCTVHLRKEELPQGRLIVRVSKHITAVIDGVIHDLYDPSRDGTRCVYGYWTQADN